MKQESLSATGFGANVVKVDSGLSDGVNGRVLHIDRQSFTARFNRSPFRVQHNLSAEPLMTLGRIRQLVQDLETRPGEVYADIDVTTVGQRWDESARPLMPMSNLVDQLATSSAWIIIRRAELDPQYRALLGRGMNEIKDACGGRWPRPIRRRNAIIFLASPRRISTYHIDRECNFILQIHGEKLIHIFDRDDREVLTEEELERFWTVDHNAAKFKPQHQDRCMTFHLRPGDGVHVPVNAPHWVQNGDDISITLSLNFQFSDFERANQYRANYYLRKLGFNPSPPGKNLARDKLKALAMSAVTILHKPAKFMQETRGRDPY